MNKSGIVSPASDLAKAKSVANTSSKPASNDQVTKVGSDWNKYATNDGPGSNKR